MKRIGMALLSALVMASMGVVYAETHAFPVPFIAKQHTKITFTDLPGSGSIKVFTIDGEEVANLVIAAGEIIKDWNVTNNAGKKLASGVYLYLIDSGNGSKSEGKLVVIR